MAAIAGGRRNQVRLQKVLLFHNLHQPTQDANCPFAADCSHGQRYTALLSGISRIVKPMDALAANAHGVRRQLSGGRRTWDA